MIADAVLGVQPLVRRHLPARAQGDQKAVGHVPLRQADLVGFAAVHIDPHFRVAYFLVDVNVDRAGNQRHAPFDFLRNLVVRLRVSSDHLDVHGRGQAEIQNLIGDVRSLKEKRQVGELGSKIGPQFASVILSGTVMSLAEGNQDFAVARPDRGAVAEGEIDAGIWKADVVQN